jgi:hypothetical protein
LGQQVPQHDVGRRKWQQTSKIIFISFQVMNAEQFKLPAELNPQEQLPYSWKWKDERQDDHETFPKNCCVCLKSSRGTSCFLDTPEHVDSENIKF